MLALSIEKILAKGLRYFPTYQNTQTFNLTQKKSKNEHGLLFVCVLNLDFQWTSWTLPNPIF